MENDRRDLAIAVREKMNDWFRIMEILQKSSAPGDDELLRKAWNHVGDYYAERQNWLARQYFRIKQQKLKGRNLLQFQGIWNKILRITPKTKQKNKQTTKKSPKTKNTKKNFCLNFLNSF